MRSAANKVGSVGALWRFPVKSMRGEQVERSEVTGSGLPGDRAYALQDLETGKIATAVEVKRYPNLFAFRATIPESIATDAAIPPARIELPDGNVVSSDQQGVDEILSSHLGRAVRLVRQGAGGPGNSATPAPYHDDAPVSVLSNSTLDSMNELQPGSLFDARRFRMNIIVDADSSGFPENEWVGSVLHLGESLRLEIVRPDARCIMTTLAQDELPSDPTILKSLARHNRLKTGGKGPYPCAGVYARVLTSGPVAVGDQVFLSAAIPDRLAPASM